jgi:hypothetical protein
MGVTLALAGAVAADATDNGSSNANSGAKLVRRGRSVMALYLRACGMLSIQQAYPRRGGIQTFPAVAGAPANVTDTLNHI